MATYDSILPRVFPYQAKVSLDYLPHLVEFLTKRKDGVPYGSSFAITSDVHDERYRHLWLSESSHKAIREASPGDLTFPVHISGDEKIHDS